MTDKLEPTFTWEIFKPGEVYHQLILPCSAFDNLNAQQQLELLQEHMLAMFNSCAEQLAFWYNPRRQALEEFLGAQTEPKLTLYSDIIGDLKLKQGQCFADYTCTAVIHNDDGTIHEAFFQKKSELTKYSLLEPTDEITAIKL